MKEQWSHCFRFYYQIIIEKPTTTTNKQKIHDQSQNIQHAKVHIWWMRNEEIFFVTTIQNNKKKKSYTLTVANDNDDDNVNTFHWMIFCSFDSIWFGFISISFYTYCAFSMFYWFALCDICKWIGLVAAASDTFFSLYIFLLCINTHISYDSVYFRQLLNCFSWYLHFYALAYRFVLHMCDGQHINCSSFLFQPFLSFWIFIAFSLFPEYLMPIDQFSKWFLSTHWIFVPQLEKSRHKYEGYIIYKTISVDLVYILLLTHYPPIQMPLTSLDAVRFNASYHCESGQGHIRKRKKKYWQIEN